MIEWIFNWSQFEGILNETFHYKEIQRIVCPPHTILDYYYEVNLDLLI